MLRVRGRITAALLVTAGLALAGCSESPCERSFADSQHIVDRRGATIGDARDERSADARLASPSKSVTQRAAWNSAPGDSPIVGVRASGDNATVRNSRVALTSNSATDDNQIQRYAAEAPVVTGPHPFATGPARTAHMLPGSERAVPASAANAPPLPLPPAASPPMSAFSGQSGRLYNASTQAMQHYRQGFSLASRGAHFSARKEFFEALNLLVEALDSIDPSMSHAEALAVGLQALTEARDFTSRGAVTRNDIDLTMIIEGHRTPVLKRGNLAGISPATAAYRYQEFAVDRLAVALDRQQAGSMAFYALGKLYSTMVESGSSTIAGADGDAIVFHQAALLIDPTNFLAANELGVLTARRGHFHTAKTLLIKSLQISQQPASWHNLAVVHARLGESQLAEQARQSALLASGGFDPADTRTAVARTAVEWVDPATFASTSHSPGTALPVQASPMSSVGPGVAPATSSNVMPVSHHAPIGGVDQQESSIGRFWKSGQKLMPWRRGESAAKATGGAAPATPVVPDRRLTQWQQ